jgi:hypothetical protein
MTLPLGEKSFFICPVCAIEMLRFDVFLEWINGFPADIRY